MKVVTFYSYKGGVGRTLAATNFAVYLAKLGLRVVIIDFDLDAPGVDSKFPDFTLPSGQRGLLDYILQFQQDGCAPGPVDAFTCSVLVSSPRQNYTINLIPAGDYLSPDYAAKLNDLDWRIIFSERRDGVAFFQGFLDRIKEELSPDVIVIDSRTGFSEIGGLCTQQLADETVILSSLSRESIKMTRHLAQLIRESEIAKTLEKQVDAKIVVSRVPKPKDIDKLKARCCKLFNADETRLFFLFSCPSLEREEFVAMLATSREDELVASYIQLFQGLDVAVAQDSIREEIARTEQGLLSCTPEEADSRIRELVALFPHPEVYRRAMRFFNLTRRHDEAFSFGLKLLDLAPDDTEAQLQVSRFALAKDNLGLSLARRLRGRVTEGVNVERVVSIAERAYESGQLSAGEKVRLADLLEDVEDYEKSFHVAMSCLQAEECSDADLRITAMGIAGRTAMKLGKREKAAEIISEIPASRLRGSLANLAIELKCEAGEKEAAFELAKTVLTGGSHPAVLQTALSLATELDRVTEIESVIRTIAEKEPLVHSHEFQWELQRAGLGHLAEEIGTQYPRRRRR
jgi:MinD-like ATPase involved in chromosome partitioning or flagellar assembly